MDYGTIIMGVLGGGGLVSVAAAAIDRAKEGRLKKIEEDLRACTVAALCLERHKTLDAAIAELKTETGEIKTEVKNDFLRVHGRLDLIVNMLTNRKNGGANGT